MSTRRIRPEVRVTSIRFSPAANAFAAASTEGLLIYSVDEAFAFDPFDLDIDVTPQTTLESLHQKEYLNAFVMAFRLNEEYLIHKVYETIPISEISLVTSNLPVIYVPRILKFIGDFAFDSQHIEFNLLWMKALLSSHGAYMKSHKHLFTSALRSIQRFIGRIAKDVVGASTDNKYAYKFLMTTDGATTDTEMAEPTPTDLIFDEDDHKAADSDNYMSAMSDDEEWTGFEEKKNKLALQNSDVDESDDDELI